MPSYNFQKRFADKVRSGEKLQTIRKCRKRPTVEGDTLYLYTGLRQKGPEKLREVKCVRVLPLEIHDDISDAVISSRSWRAATVKVGLDWTAPDEMDAFAVADGFADAEDFFAFWRNVHGLTADNPLLGFELIQWEK